MKRFTNTSILRQGNTLNYSPAKLCQRLMDLSARTETLITPAMISSVGSPPQVRHDAPCILVPEVHLDTPEKTFEFAKKLLAISLKRIGWEIHNFLNGVKLNFDFGPKDNFIPYTVKWKVIDLVGQTPEKENTHDTLGDVISSMSSPVFTALYALALYDEYIPNIGDDTGGGYIPQLVFPSIKVTLRQGTSSEAQGIVTLHPNKYAKRVRLEHVLLSTRRFHEYSIPLVGEVETSNKKNLGQVQYLAPGFSHQDQDQGANENAESRSLSAVA